MRARACAAKGFNRTQMAKPKEPLPSKKELAETAKAIAMAAESTAKKNFVQANAVENMLSAPKKKEAAIDWTKKPYFGETPPYLKAIKKEIEDEYNDMRTMQEEAMRAPPTGFRRMPEQERLELVEALKTKWDAINSEYQKTSTLSPESLDTIGKKKRCVPGAWTAHP